MFPFFILFFPLLFLSFLSSSFVCLFLYFISFFLSFFPLNFLPFPSFFPLTW
jgi:hypothetical protein